MSTGFDALKRGQDDMRQLSTTLDALKRDLDKERSRTAALEQRLNEMNEKPPSCPEGYTISRGICYKAFDTKKTFSGAAAACREDGGTLAMPRNSETNVFLASLYKSVHFNANFWFGLHDQRTEGSFDWVDGFALGKYNSWAPGQPNNLDGNQDCVRYSTFSSRKPNWDDAACNWSFYFICQAVP
ncbi:alpha-N-acetylgalactosamine-specific lectin-like isoform X2 [Branchiostoma lanceolatum]